MITDYKEFDTCHGVVFEEFLFDELSEEFFILHRDEPYYFIGLEKGSIEFYIGLSTNVVLIKSDRIGNAAVFF